jgi:hypothetical protein
LLCLPKPSSTRGYKHVYISRPATGLDDLLAMA